jgi:hypothetical protein
MTYRMRYRDRDTDADGTVCDEVERDGYAGVNLTDPSCPVTTLTPPPVWYGMEWERGISSDNMKASYY